MRFVLIVLLLLIPSAVCSSPRFFSKNQLFSRTWTKTTGWCFSSKWRKLPKWFKPHVCVPKRWGAADACVLQKINVNKNAYFLVGHKLTYAKFRYEFLKKKEQFAHGPYVHFHIKW